MNWFFKKAMRDGIEEGVKRGVTQSFDVHMSHVIEAIVKEAFDRLRPVIDDLRLQITDRNAIIAQQKVKIDELEKQLDSTEGQPTSL